MEKKKKVFVVKKGLKTGIFIDHDWDQDIKSLVTGYPSALFKSFSNLNDAELYWNEKHSIRKESVETFGSIRPAVPLTEEPVSSDSRKRKRSIDSTSPLQIYTDGSCLFNGTKRARAGFGVYFGPGDSRNISSRLENQDQTNNRAELMAIIKALEIIQDHQGRVEIHSDSQYCSQGVTSWIYNWKLNGWKTAAKAPVKNKDLWMMLDRLYCTNPRKERVAFVWIKGHSGNKGNDEADKLANEGARK